MRKRKNTIRLSITTLLLFAFTVTCGQGLTNPCDNGDIDAPECPLDTYMYFMIFIALAFTVRYLSKQQKATTV